VHFQGRLEKGQGSVLTPRWPNVPGKTKKNEKTCDMCDEVFLCQKLFCVKINFVTKGYMYVVSSRAASKFPGYWGRNGHFLVEIWLSLTDKKSLNCRFY
jgi:hypothetical protein